MSVVFKKYDEIQDVVGLLIWCEDNTYLLHSEGNTDYWIANYKVKNKNWNKTANTALKEILNNTDVRVDRILRVYKLWLPDTFQCQYVFHVVFAHKLSVEVKRNIKTIGGKSSSKFKWYPENDMIRLSQHGSAKSPEITEFLARAKSCDFHEPFNVQCDAFGYSDTNKTFIEIHEESTIVDIGRDVKTMSVEDQTIKAANFTSKDQQALYREFLVMCFPAILMNKTIFCKFLMDIGTSRDAALGIFKAADTCNRHCLNFLEFLLILAAIEPNTAYTGGPADIRNRYIARYYDSNKDGKIDQSELRNAILDTRKSLGLATDGVQNEVDTQIKDVGLSLDNPITVSEFMRALSDTKFRGAGHLLRNPISLMKFLADTNTPGRIDTTDEGNTDAKRAKFNNTSRSLATSGPAASLPRERKSSNKILSEQIIRGKLITNYEVALHTIKLMNSGNVIEVNILGELNDGKDTKTDLTSLDTFDQKSTANELLSTLRYFSCTVTQEQASQKYGRTPKEPYTWGTMIISSFGRSLVNLCGKVRQILQEEPRLIELASPAYVLGDLHGNYPDLMYFEKMLWHLGPGLTPISLLFLGDYVDRGPHGVEVIAYLFSYKAQNPLRIKLLRGNHEIRTIQSAFTFEKECLQKFGEALGREVWNAVNSAFDAMPLAAVIDEKIFCCHGGIPPPWLCPVIKAINLIPSPLPAPDEQSPMAWELMWNDPVKAGKVSNDLIMEMLANEGFAHNTRRGTAHVFSAEALEKFLAVNNLTHVIRAHEVQQVGFGIQQKGHLLTVFSSSKYCGGSNESAVILADRKKLRVFRFETNE